MLVLKEEADPHLGQSSKEAPAIKVTWKKKNKTLKDNKSKGKPSKKSLVVIKKEREASKLKVDISWKKVCKAGANQAYAAFILENSNAIPFKYNRGKFMCAYCDFICPAMNQLRSHSSTHEKLDNLFKRGILFPLRIEITDLACTICSLRVDSIDNLKSHLDHEHSKKPPAAEDEDGSVVPFILTKNEYKCVHCEETFITFMNLLLHTNLHYQNHVCHVCGKGFANDQKLKRHKMMHDDENCECPKCSEVLPTRAARMRHIAVVHGPKNRYRCPICDATFSSYHMRLRHLDREHGQKSEYPCGQCSAVFATGMCRSAHIRTVHKKIRRKRQKKPS